MYACMHACMHVCMYACMHVCMHARMHVCMYAGIVSYRIVVSNGMEWNGMLCYVMLCMYVCMYTYVYIIYTQVNTYTHV